MNARPSRRTAAQVSPPPQSAPAAASTPATSATPVKPAMQTAPAPADSTFERVLAVPVVGTLVGGVVQAKLALFDGKGEAPGDKAGVAATILKSAAFPFVTVGYWLAGAVGRLTRN